MKDFYNVLSKCSLFKDIKEEEFESLFACLNSYIKNFESDEFVFLEGEEVNFVSVVISGSLEIIKENFAGTRYIMDFLTTSDLFAEGIVCTKNRISPVTVRVKENSKVLFIPYERIIKPCGNLCIFHNLLIKNMMMILGEKNFSMNHKIELLILKGMREKIAAFLLVESKRNNSMTFQITPNRNELAEHLNVSRTSMCRELARMKEDGILDYYQNSFKILSIEKLKNHQQ